MYSTESKTTLSSDYEEKKIRDIHCVPFENFTGRLNREDKEIQRKARDRDTL